MKYIMVAKVFPAHHPKAGKPTGFSDAILLGIKWHTLRTSAGNLRTGDRVSLREWEKQPYRSRQIEFARCFVSITPMQINGWSADNAALCPIALRDGFVSPTDFVAWFDLNRTGRVYFSGVCVWFNAVLATEEQP